LKTPEIAALCRRAVAAQRRFHCFIRPPSFAGKTGGSSNVKGGGMAKLTLYHASPSRSSIVRWMLEEIGEPYDIHLLRLMEGDQQKPDYLAINPMGKVPALKHGDVVITEAAAICTYLADEFPQARLNVPIGDPRRGLYLKWLFFGPRLRRARDHRPRLSAERRAAAERARLWRFRHGDERAGQRRGQRPFPHGRAVHRSRRGHRLDAALGHDVQSLAQAA
jgi:glutathione S-transferase